MKKIEIPVGKRTKTYRFFEMLPALLSYSIILLPIILSLINPILAAVFIMAYLIFWFIKAIAMAYRTIQGYSVFTRAQKVDWAQRLADLEDIDASLKKHEGKRSKAWHFNTHVKNLHRMTLSRALYYKPSDVYTALIIPTYKESRDVLIPTIESVLNSHYNTKQNMLFIIGYEERAGEEDEKIVLELLEKYKDNFFFAAATKHPKDLPNEVPGKGGNIVFAGKYLQKVLEEKQIDPDKVIVTTLDADNRPDPSYFAYVTYEYIVDLEHMRRAYQPIALYMNNIWDVPAPMRVLATGNSFWTIINSLRPHMLRNFSTHAQGMSSLIATNFWSTRTIVEDGHQYWRSYFTFDGDYEVTPIYVPIYQDAVLAPTYWQTIKEQFIQLRRWAYGASDVPYVAMMGFRKDRTMPFWAFFTRWLRLLESHVSWATASLIIAFGAWAPLFINMDANRSIVAHELPLIASQLQQLALVGLFITIFLTFKMLPPRPARYKRHRNIFMLLQWLVMPITSIAYGCLAALNSQTRLLFGRYLEKFDSTLKAVKK